MVNKLYGSISKFGLRKYCIKTLSKSMDVEMYATVSLTMDFGNFREMSVKIGKDRKL